MKEFVASSKMADKEKESVTSESEDRSDLSVSDQLCKIEKLLNNLDSRIDRSEDNLSKKIEDNFENLRSQIFSLQKSYDELKEKYDDAEDQLEDLQDEVTQLKKELAKQRERHNNIEQYQRRDSLRFLGIGPDNGKETEFETEKTVLNIINSDLKLGHIRSDDISIAHRVGQKTTKPRAIIVKFLSRKNKNLVLSKRRLLKGSGRGIIEDLTPLNFNRLNAVKKHSNVENVWTKEGVITALLKNGRIVRVEEGDFGVLGTNSSDVPNIEMQPAEDRGHAADKQAPSSQRQDASHRQRTPPRSSAPSLSRRGRTGPVSSTQPLEETNGLLTKIFSAETGASSRGHRLSSERSSARQSSAE